MLSARWALALAVLLAACGGGKGPARDPHARVACVGCHRGARAPSGQSGVPDAACSSRGCHPGGRPDSVRIAMVTFKHGGHPMSGWHAVGPGDGAGGAKDAGVAKTPSSGARRSVPCAACHTHQQGSGALTADSTTCALCHFAEVAGTKDAGCATCHPNPRHTRSTSQGVPLPHAMLSQAHVPCARCHYRLVEGDTTVALARCVACHGAKTPAKLPRADSAHARHPERSCRSCHAAVTHRVVAMSGSIALECMDCHDRRHRRPIPADTSATAKCSDCHAGVHAEQQRLMIGAMPGEELGPSLMFMGGVTCRSCHVAPEGPRPRPGASLKPGAGICVGCHGSAWTGVLGRWTRGYQRRAGWIGAYLAAADTALGPQGATTPAARAKLAEAKSLMSFVAHAGPTHNLAAADRIMREALALAGGAYRAAGRPAPPPPELGPPVRPGTCISCHYGIEEAATGRDSTAGRRTTHADHLFRAFLPCDACHAAGAAPPGVPDSLWIRAGSDTAKARPN